MKEAPFGTYALTKREKIAQQLGAIFGRDPISKLARSVLKSIAGAEKQQPRDLTVFNTQRARLHPYDNICEKRVFLTPHLWEAKERSQLKEHILHHPHDDFYFVDAGSNVGLFTLFAYHCALAANKKVHAACIEPGDVVRSRLEFNLKASNIENAIVFPLALSGNPGVVQFSPHTENLGESRIYEDITSLKHAAVTVKAKTLFEIIKMAEFPRVDALKIDIEGHEKIVLNAFFKQTATKFHPSLIIMEIAHAKDEEILLSLCTDHGYQVVQRVRGNVVLSMKN